VENDKITVVAIAFMNAVRGSFGYIVGSVKTMRNPKINV